MKKMFLLYAVLVLSGGMANLSFAAKVQHTPIFPDGDTTQHIPVFVFDSVRHIRCPDGEYNVYPADGAFAVHLTDSVQYYQRIEVHSSFYLFDDQIFHNSFYLQNLNEGTYYVTAYGTNGTTFMDSVTIEKPAPWASDLDNQRIDTVCPGETGCVLVSFLGGTPPYQYTWFYYTEDESQVFMEDTGNYVCGLEGGGRIYCFYMYDSRGCKVFGEGIDLVYLYLWEYATDVEIVGDSILQACEGEEVHLSAISSTPGVYTWCVGDVCDNSNAYVYQDLDGTYVSGFFSPPVTESGWMTVSFDNWTPCPKPRDSVYVEVIPPAEIEMDTVLKSDTNYIIYFHPSGGDVYIDQQFVANVSSGWMILHTENLTSGEHLMTYKVEGGLHCDSDERNLLFRVESAAGLPEWGLDVRFYPNPVMDNLHVTCSSGEELTFTITDMAGRPVRNFTLSDNSTDVDVSDLASGAYMLRTSTRTGMAKTLKLIKK
ncbi:MAG: T9SS type A sorting domain-containing protein [Bacteroidales bacterium]|nr:T9SS type A sorting domain-containing protein [Bacteroidales bacterium]